MGISKDAVRRRIQRGTLAAHKGDDDRWLVIIPEDNGDDGETEPRATSRDSTGTARRDDEFLAVIATFREQLEAKDQQLTEKDRQIAAKDQQLEQAAIERAELRRLLGNAQQT